MSGYGLARAVLSDPRFSARAELKRVPVSRPGADPFIGDPALPGWFIDMDPPDHTTFRRLLASHFTRHRMRTIRPRIEQVVAQQLDELHRHGSPADLVSGFALPTALQVLCDVLGIPYTARETIRRNRETLFSLEASSEEGATAMEVLTDFLLDVIEQKVALPADDLLSDLAHGSGLSRIELAGVGVLLLTAGHDTVASMLSLGTLALLLHPEQLHAIDWSAEAVDTMLEELLRYLSIFHLGVPRMPLTDVELGGHRIRAGESVTIAIPSANHDPTRFTDPAKLDIRRTEGGNLAFGHGVHQCIGQNLARIQMQVGYPALFRRFPTLTLPVEADDIAVARDGAIYSLHTLPVTW